MDPKKAVETLSKQYKRQNDYIKDNYKRVSVTIPNKIYDMLLDKNPDIKLNGYINDLIKADLEAVEHPEVISEQKQQENNFSMNPPAAEDNIPDCFK